MFSSAIGRLRIISIIEGLSFLYLLYHSIYSKRILGIEDAIRVPGMIHGVLFCLFCIALLDATLAHKWKLKIPSLIFLASLIPFAPIWVELWLKKQSEKDQSLDASN
ncbi:membrane protein [Oceaniferula spumae]|uniref:Membrane protein n=1 Tax=Oceaniferula spumae TaxID=2979115 RepID=A0AAT9FPZ4_9BACT